MLCTSRHPFCRVKDPYLMHLKGFAGEYRNTHIYVSRTKQNKTKHHFRIKEPESTRARGGSWGTSMRFFQLPSSTLSFRLWPEPFLFFFTWVLPRNLCSQVSSDPPAPVVCPHLPLSCLQGCTSAQFQELHSFLAKRGLTLYFHQFSLNLLALKVLKINLLLYLVWFWSLI